MIYVAKNSDQSIYLRYGKGDYQRGEGLEVRQFQSV